jgi:hypothetical protein
MYVRFEFLRRRHDRKADAEDGAPGPKSSTANSPSLQRNFRHEENAALITHKPPMTQFQSPFLTRLPLDIRLLIYERVLAAARRLHIVEEGSGKNLGHIECNFPKGDGGIAHCNCWAVYTANGLTELKARNPHCHRGKMRLLLSCKTMLVPSASLHCTMADYLGDADTWRLFLSFILTTYSVTTPRAPS